MALYRCGMGGGSKNIAVDTENILCSSGANTISISATKNMKKALLVATAAHSLATDTYSGGEKLVTVVSSNKTLTSLPGTNNNLLTATGGGNLPRYIIEAACLLYLVDDVKIGDTFELTQKPSSSMFPFYEKLTLICLD